MPPLPLMAVLDGAIHVFENRHAEQDADPRHEDGDDEVNWNGVNEK
ncbi:hypothetical protein [Microvirga makkahensis]|uniref:Uncharacterized protein n=1 Tax=Microvirga makkahensis TaxID=1128670 RepID=A0A7X3MV85_9HYPH|nr:hypothetical protein [Microvirga makkahensis]MXQ13839.1 hypothetical protein [Microvirga makkahensis]